MAEEKHTVWSVAILSGFYGAAEFCQMYDIRVIIVTELAHTVSHVD